MATVDAIDQAAVSAICLWIDKNGRRFKQKGMDVDMMKLQVKGLSAAEIKFMQSVIVTDDSVMMASEMMVTKDVKCALANVMQSVEDAHDSDFDVSIGVEVPECADEEKKGVSVFSGTTPRVIIPKSQEPKTQKAVGKRGNKKLSVSSWLNNGLKRASEPSESVAPTKNVPIDPRGETPFAIPGQVMRAVKFVGRDTLPENYPLMSFVQDEKIFIHSCYMDKLCMVNPIVIAVEDAPWVIGYAFGSLRFLFDPTPEMDVYDELFNPLHEKKTYSYANRKAVTLRCEKNKEGVYPIGARNAIFVKEDKSGVCFVGVVSLRTCLML